MSRVIAWIACCLGLVFCGGCASIVSGTNQSLSVTTSSEGIDIDGAKCQLDNDKGSWFVTTPGSVTVRRSYKDLMVVCGLDGHDKAQQLAKSSTKGMVLGNALFGGVIGVGVDVSTGAAYDYPSLIAVAMTRAPGAAAAIGGGAPGPLAVAPRPVAALPVASIYRSGVRLTFQEVDAYSRAALGESTLSVVDVTPTQIVFNDGAVVTALDGTPIKGAPHGLVLFGFGARDPERGGPWRARLRPAGYDDTEVTISVVGRQTKVVSGQRFEATRVRLQGYASRSGLTGGSSANGAFFEGEALVDNASGLVLELSTTSRSSAYAVRRELVRVAAAP